METRVTDREVTDHLDKIIERIAQSGETLVVERDGKPVLRIGPIPTESTVADLIRLFEKYPPDEAFRRDVLESINSHELAVPRSPWDC